MLGVLAAVFLGGCQGVEPENRAYPMAMAVEAAEKGYQVILGMPDMQSATGQDKQAEGSSQSVLILEGETFQDIRNLYDRTQEKYLDLGHLKALIFGEKLIEEKKWSDTLRFLKEESFVGEDIYVFKTEDIEKLMERNGDQGISAGEYLTGIYENRPKHKARKGVTLKEVYHNWYRFGDLPVLPGVRADEDGMEIEPF